VTLTGASTTTASFTAPSSGATLTFKLTVTDNQGTQGLDTVNVVVNTAPTVNAGPDQSVSPSAAVTLSGSATDFDGTVVSYSWTQTAGTTVMLTGASTATASFTAPSTPGALTFRLSATDNEGVSNNDTVNVIVPAPNIGGGRGRGCFIATAAFGTPMAQEVRYLRAFRDQYLLSTTVGREFVRLYYKFSPPLADYLRRHDGLRAMVRGALAPLVALSKTIVSPQTMETETADRP
jgi:hypothetical protein